MTSFAGAVLFPDQGKTVLFKNRDLTADSHKDELVYDVDTFGVRGIDMNTSKVTGLTIGVNRHGLAVANTHVKSTDDVTYDVLTEQILMFAKDAEDGLSMTVEHLRSGKSYQWGNLILADHDSMLAIEIAGDDHSIEWSERKVLRTGHHIMLDTEDVLRQNSNSGEVDDYELSVKKVERGYELIRNVKSVNDVFSLLKDHGDSPGQSSICRHQAGPESLETKMSYIIEIDHSQDVLRPKVMFHVSNGVPCQVSYSTIPLLFPADEDVMRRVQSMYFK
jgi:hypothetical protein